MDPEKCRGKPCIRSPQDACRIQFSHNCGSLSIEEMLKQWPELEREDIYQALGFATTLMRRASSRRDVGERHRERLRGTQRHDQETNYDA